MTKKIVFVFIFVFVGFATVFSQDEIIKDIKGTIEEVADDGTYIVLDGKKILTPSALTQCQYYLVGDDAIVKVKEVKSGLVAVDCQYNLEHTATSDYDDLGAE